MLDGKWVCSAIVCCVISCHAGAVATLGEFEALQRRTSETLARKRAAYIDASFRMQDPEILLVSHPNELQQVRNCRMCWNGEDYWIAVKYDYLTTPSRNAAVMSYDRGMPTTGTVVLGRFQTLFSFREGKKHGSVRVLKKYLIDEYNEVIRTEDTALYGPEDPMPTEVYRFRALLANGLLGGWNQAGSPTLSRAGEDAFNVESDSVGLHDNTVRGRISATISDAGAIRSLTLDREGGGYEYEVLGTGETRFEGITFNREVLSMRRYVKPDMTTRGITNIQMRLKSVGKCGADNSTRSTVEAVFQTDAIRNASETTAPFKEIECAEIVKIGDAFDFQ